MLSIDSCSQVEAQDLGNPQKQATTSIVVTIRPSSDEPVFVPPVIPVTVLLSKF